MKPAICHQIASYLLPRYLLLCRPSLVLHPYIHTCIHPVCPLASAPCSILCTHLLVSCCLTTTALIELITNSSFSSPSTVSQISQIEMSLNPPKGEYQIMTVTTRPSVTCECDLNTYDCENHFQLTLTLAVIWEMCSIKLVFLFWIKAEEIIHMRLHPSALTDHRRSLLVTS